MDTIPFPNPGKFWGKVASTPPPPKNPMISGFLSGHKRENLLGQRRHAPPNLRKVPTLLVINQRKAGKTQEGKNVVPQRLHNREAYPAPKQSRQLNEEIASQSLEFAGSINRVCKRYLGLWTYSVIKSLQKVND